MANYTIELYNLLKLYALPGESVTNIADMTRIAQRSIFSEAPMNLLSNIAQEYLIPQLTSHYFTHEIGYESEELFRVYLNGTILENYDQINAIYEDISKQAYTEFTKNAKKSNGTRIKAGSANDRRVDSLNSKNNSTNINNLSSQRDNTGSQENNGFNNNVQSNNIQNIINERGYTTLNKSGSDISNDSGSQVNNNDLRDVLSHNTHDRQEYGSSNAITHNSNDDHSYNIQDKTEYNSTDTQNYGSIDESLKNTKQTEKKFENYDLVSEKSFEDREREKSYEGKQIDHGDVRADNNALNLTYDTPQGSLDELRDPGGIPGSGSGQSAVDKGFAYAAGQSYNYFSAAAEAAGTTWTTNDNERSFEDYKETDKDSGKEINTEKHRIDGSTNKDEREVLTKFEPNTMQVSDGQGGTRSLNGDVNFKSGSDNNKKTGDDTVKKTGSENVNHSGSDVDIKSGADERILTGDDTTIRTGSTTQVNNNSQVMTYGSKVKDEKNLDTTNARIGTVADNATSGSKTIDDLHENINSQGSTINVAQTESEGVVQNEHVESGSDVTSNNGDEETYKIDLLKWTMMPNFMDKLWAIFDDLFMWLGN